MYGIGGTIAYQNSAGTLAIAGRNNNRSYGLGMAAGTSPSITELDGGGFEIAFQANTGSLWTVGSAGQRNWGLGMKAGTSPSIAGLVGGGYVVAFQANTGDLFTAGTLGTRNLGLGMKAGTSPSVTGLAIGGFQIAFQANTGTLWTAGSAGQHNWGLGMAAGTSPNTRLSGTNAVAVAFQANTGELWTLGPGGASDWKYAVAAGTSPSAVNVRSVYYSIAYQAPAATVNVVSAYDDSHPGLGMAPHTSPSVAADGMDQVAAFQANTGELWVTSPSYSYGLGVHLAAGTSPSISSVLAFSKHQVPNFYSVFYLHGSQVIFRSDGTGQEATHAGFTKDGRWVNQLANLHTYLSADHYTLIVTITSVSYVAYNSDGSTSPVGNPYSTPDNRVGDSFWVNQVEPGLFRAVLINLGAPGNDGSFGNPYLCHDPIAAPWSFYCGA